MSLDFTPDPPVFCAAWQGDLAEVKRLLEDDPDLVTSTNPNGHTLLSIAVGQKNKELVELLLSFGAPVMQVDGNMQFPMDLARKGGNREVIAILKAHGAPKTSGCVVIALAVGLPILGVLTLAIG